MTILNYIMSFLIYYEIFVNDKGCMEMGSPRYVMLDQESTACPETYNLLTMKRQWTYGPALLPWFNHFDTSLACFTAL